MRVSASLIPHFIDSMERAAIRTISAVFMFRPIENVTHVFELRRTSLLRSV